MDDKLVTDVCQCESCRDRPDGGEMKYFAKGGLLEQAEARIAELEEALRDIIEDVDHEDHVKGDWSWVVVVKRARRVLAAAQPEKKEG